MATKPLTASREAARFHTMIATHPDLRVVKTIPATQTVFFHHFGSGATTEIPHLLEQLAKHGADILLGVLEGRIDPRRILHISRIVGYFSRVRDWNRSKQAELRDRRKGDYAIPTGDYQVGGRAIGREGTASPQRCPDHGGSPGWSWCDVCGAVNDYCTDALEDEDEDEVPDSVPGIRR